jgi:GGDEF domain-containing protein
MIKLLSWVVPGGVILGIAVALVLGPGSARLPDLSGGFLPVVVFVAALLLAGFYHRSRLAVMLLGLAALFWVHSTRVDDAVTFHFGGGLYFVAVGCLALLRDRGVSSRVGLAQLGGALLFGSCGGLLVFLSPGDIASFLSVEFLAGGEIGWPELPQPVALAFCFAAISSLVSVALRRGPVERGIAWHVLAVVLALSFAGQAGAPQVFMLAAGTTLGLSVMETSYAMAFRDELTELPARRALMRDLEAMERSFAAAMVDVDHFKRFNDRYGHDVGDQVLRMVAAKLAKAPGGGRAYRYGGEEFTVVYPGKTREDALPHLERLCKTVEDASFTLRSWRRPRKRPVDPSAWRGVGDRAPKRLSVTVSIGVADVAGGDPSPDAVLKRADQALYQAKNGGRNRVAK